ncbi:hypothetical protein AB0K14_03120 [Actinosynnema sp. NPDC050801]
MQTSPMEVVAAIVTGLVVLGRLALNLFESWECSQVIERRARGAR